jgi:hypothetical protein
MLRDSIIRKNPLYPVTMPLIQRLVADDLVQFGQLPRLRFPDLTHLCAVAAAIERVGDSIVGVPPPSPPSPCPSPSRSTPGSRTSGTAVSSSLAAMANSSLPPRKRRLLPAEAEEAGGLRGSVIQFGLRA